MAVKIINGRLAYQYERGVNKGKWVYTDGHEVKDKRMAVVRAHQSAGKSDAYAWYKGFQEYPVEFVPIELWPIEGTSEAPTTNSTIG